MVNFEPLSIGKSYITLEHFSSPPHSNFFLKLLASSSNSASSHELFSVRD
jgi:hypothetical protein